MQNGELGISCHLVKSERVLYGGKQILGPGWRKFAIFYYSFPISGIAKLL